jgi:phosphohistidine phosphatase
MKLYLMQHGKNLPFIKDPGEGLSQEGRDTIISSANAIAQMNITFDVIISSTKKRAVQTAQIVKEQLFFKEEIIQTEKVKPMTDAKESIEFLMQYIDEESVLIAGHLPSIINICSYLLGKDNLQIDIQNGSLVCLDSPNLKQGSAILNFYMLPDQLNKIS